MSRPIDDKKIRLIDADALPRHGRRGGLVNWKDIENAPTVDAVPVVRCKDCKYFLGWVSNGKDVFDCIRFLDAPPITSDWYCAWGERKEDD